MLEKLLRFSLTTRLSAFLLAAVLAVWGYNAYKRLTIEAFPDPTDTQVQVITLFSGQPTEEVERRVSIPIERALNGTPGLLGLRSISLFGLSFVTLTFNDATDPMQARQMVVERLSGTELPEDVHPTLGPMATPIGEVYRYTLDGGNQDPMSLRTLQDWVVRPQLLQVQGVADVVSYGGLIHEIHVQPDPAQLAQLGVGLSDVFTALSRASANASGGYVERGSEMFVIRSLGTFKDIGDIQRVRVGYHAGVPVTVRDVAKVTDGYAPRQGIVTRGHNEDAVEGIVLMRRGQNPTVVLEGLQAKLADLNGRILPKGVTVKAFYDRTELVNTTLHTVFKNLAEGAALVIFVLFAFMLSLRASLIVAAVIPLSLATSFIYLQTRGMSANLLSMGAVDFGIIVDGAVILVEHLFEKLSKDGPEFAGSRRDLSTLVEHVFEVAREVARPTLFSLLIIIAAYLPIFGLERVEGRIFAPLAHTVVSALIGALIVSFTLVPVLSLFALRKPEKHRESPLLVGARKLFNPSLLFALRNGALIIILGLGTLLSSAMLMPRLGSEFLPELNEGALYVTFALPGNLSLSQGRLLTPRIKAELSKTPEVTELLSQLGRPEDGTDPKLPNNLEVFIKLKPLEQWRKHLGGLNGIIEEMDKNLRNIPGLDYNFSQPIRDNVADNISGQIGQVALKIYGDDVDHLKALAEKAKDVIQDVPGAVDVGVVRAGETPQMSITINRAALARYDLDLGEVQDYVETALGGHVASELWEGQKRWDVTVRLPPASREDLNSIRHILLPMKDGSLLPLSALAQINMATGRAAITREFGRRYIGVRMNVRNRDLASFVQEAQDRTAHVLTLKPGEQVSWAGEFENQRRAMERLKLIIPIALGITFLLLFSAFGSIFDAALIMVNVPFALVGGIFALALASMPLSVAAAVGFIALLGQAVLNGVLVVSSIRGRLEAGQDPETAVMEGTRERLRAVLMTALLAALGLLPAALSHAIGSETQRPIAVVVVGGTISAALLTLIFLPVTYLAALRIRQKFKRSQLGLQQTPA